MAVEAVQRCARMNFQAARIVRDGVGYTGLVSGHRTQINQDGGCKRICADVVLDPGRGKFGLSIESEGLLCYGGFANVQGKVTGALRGVLDGHIVIMFSVTECDPAAIDYAMRGLECTQPPAPPHYLCDDRPVPPGWECIHCIREGLEAERITCTIEQNTTSRPCDAYGTPGVPFRVFPIGAGIYPDPGMEDIYGDAAPFYANDGRTGLVRYHLQPIFRARVDPLWLPEGWEDICYHCYNWLCFHIKHYLGPGDVSTNPAWGMDCTEVLAVECEGEEWQACCHQNFGVWYCEYVDRAWCDAMNGTFMGPGTTCETVTCNPLYWRACCLPCGGCANVDAEVCVSLGGHSLGPMTACGTHAEQCVSVNPDLAFRELAFVFQEAIGVAEFNFTGESRCFRLYDNYCLTDGPDVDLCGGPCFDHVGHGNPNQLYWLDSIQVDFSEDFGWAETSEEPGDRYPHAEPEYIRIANAAFGMLEDLFPEVNHHERSNSYDRSSLNHWWEERSFWCLDAPAVPMAGGGAWPIYVVPYRTTCAFPADLVLQYAKVEFWLSGDPGNTDWDYSLEDNFKVRVLARLKVQIQLAVRLLPGWEDIECPVQIAEDLQDRCAPAFADPSQVMLFTSDGATRVPLELHWIGIHGPRPWSKGPFLYEQASQADGLPCCPFICAIDGLVIPAEVDDTEQPDAGQRYRGDVVLLNPTGRYYCRCAN